MTDEPFERSTLPRAETDTSPREDSSDSAYSKNSLVVMEVSFAGPYPLRPLPSTPRDVHQTKTETETVSKILIWTWTLTLTKNEKEKESESDFCDVSREEILTSIWTLSRILQLI